MASLYEMMTGQGTPFGTGNIEGMGGGSNIFGPTDVLSTFQDSPAALWQAARIRQMGQQAAIPQYQRTAMQGFTPALGGWMLGGAPTQSFSQYLDPTTTGYTGAGGAVPNVSNWASAVAASKALDPLAAMPEGGLTGQQIRQQGFLTGENARRNALAMAGAAMGGGVGYGAQAQQRALGNLYDLYAARAAGAGAPAGGFLGYLGGIVNTAGMSGYKAPSTAAPVLPFGGSINPADVPGGNLVG
jgi:hypothetical protein